MRGVKYKVGEGRKYKGGGNTRGEEIQGGGRDGRKYKVGGDERKYKGGGNTRRGGIQGERKYKGGLVEERHNRHRYTNFGGKVGRGWKGVIYCPFLT